MHEAGHAFAAPAGRDIARVLLTLGHPADAIAHYGVALLRHPDDVEAWSGKAEALRSTGDAEGALSSIRQAVALAPGRNDLVANVSLLLQELQRPGEAIDILDRLISQPPITLNILLQRGNTLLALDRFDEAAVCFSRAVATNPDGAAAHAGLATSLYNQERSAEALPALRTAIRLDPSMDGLRWNEALACLSLGDYATGWPLFEQRSQTKLPCHAAVERPRWVGQGDIVGRSVLICHEPAFGFGDTIHFCRYATLLAQRGALVSIHAPSPLVRLLATLPGIVGVHNDDEPPPDHDFYVPVMSLPFAFRTRLDTIPAHVPYLRADVSAAALWRDRLTTLPGFKIGVAWTGKHRPEDKSAWPMNRRRSIALTKLAPLAALPGVHLISLQKDLSPDQSADRPADMILHDWTDQLSDFADTAALIESLDLVISVCTSVVHLTGAMGKPVWVMNPFAGCWRWMRNRTDSPWYPDLQLFTQPSHGDWDSVIGRITAALRARLSAGAD